MLLLYSFVFLGHKVGLTGWIQTTWLPYTDRVPVRHREAFISQIVDTYLEKFPPDRNGYIHVDMVRLEVEAKKNP